MILEIKKAKMGLLENMMNLEKLCKKLLFVLVCMMMLSLQGCMVAAIGAGVGAWKYGNAEKKRAASECKKQYNDYLTKIPKNTDSKNILTLSQYCPED